tara:strand:+ start:921 stop:1847 length:927 start_codon:yes stop_codon:yes gene_type:complete
MSAEEQTFTVNTDPSTETSAENLTPEEQDSLAVGEKMESEQDQLLAGKYKNAEELEKAYGELERKLGEKDNQDIETTDETEVQETTEVSEEKTETEEIIEENLYVEDGVVNYETVNQAYGEKLGDLFKESNIDPWAISQRFRDSEGSIEESDYKQLESAGLSRRTIDAYLQGRAVEMGYTETSDSNDISDSTVADIKKAAGGDEAYGNMVNWASDNLDKNAIGAFDEIINTGSADAIKLAVSGLKSQYEDATGKEGTMVTGKAPTAAPQGYRSQAELVAAMNDQRYDSDPAYRQDVIGKLEQSNNLGF